MSNYTNFLSDELSEHKWLVEIAYYDTVNLTTGTLYYATTVFGTIATDTPSSQLYEPRLLNGYNFSGAASEIGQFGGLLPARDGGSIMLAQNMGDLDALRLYSFDGRRVVIRHGGFSPKYGELAYTDYAVVFDGEVEGQALIGIDTVTLKLRNKDTRLEFPIQDRFYSGGRYWLWFDGVNDYVDCAHSGDTYDDATVGTNFGTTNFTVEFQIYVEAASIGAVRRIVNRGLASTDGWAIRLTAAGAILFETSQAGAIQATTSGLLPRDKRTHVAVVRSGANCLIYIDGVLSVTGTTHINPAASARNLYLGRTDAGGGYFWGFLDEVRIWAAARTEEQINTYMNRQLESNEIVAPLRWYSKFDDGTGTVLSEEVVPTTNGTISGATWYASLQGGEDLQGVPLPDVFGQRIGFAPVLCDEPRLIYQVHSGSIYSLDKVFVGGVTIALDSAAYSSMALFMAKGVTGTAAGKYDILVTQNGTWFRLGSAPNKPVTALLRGDNTGGTGYGDAATYRYTAGDIVRYIICNRGPQPLTDPTDLDTTSFSDLNSANSAIVGDSCYEEKTIAEVVAFLLGSIGAVGWFERSTGIFSVVRFAGVSDKTADTALTEKDCEEDTLESIDVGPPIWGVDLNYRRNDLIHSTTDIAQAIITASDVTPPDINWRFLMTEWRTVRPRRQNIRTAYKGATILQLDTALTLHSDAIAEALRLLDLYNTQGQCIRGFFNQNAVQLDRMDTVSFHFQDIDKYGVYQSRLGTTATTNFLVIAVEDDVENGGTWLTLYREAIS